MTFTERLRTAAQLQDDEELGLLLMQAADRIESQSMWKLKWAEMDHAHAELRKRYDELQQKFDDYRKESQKWC
jgi:hypothetical protein